MTERLDDHRLLAQYLTEIRKKPLVTPAQELALGEQKNAGAKARQQLTSGSFVTREEGRALAELMRAGDQAHTALVEGNVQGSSWFPLHICGVKPTVSEELQFNQQVCGGEAKHTLHTYQTPR